MDDELARISARTLAHYDGRADAFWKGTRDHDVSQNRDALLRHLEGTPPFTILDLGCGPGRDLAAFKELGHEAVGLDGSTRFVEMARRHSGCEVLHQSFGELTLPVARFDGVFANASLFHVPSAILPRVLSELRSAVKTRGVLLSSNPRGDDDEGWHGDRYGRYHADASWIAVVEAAGFELLEQYYRPPGRPVAEQPWLVTVFRRTESQT